VGTGGSGERDPVVSVEHDLSAEFGDRLPGDALHTIAEEAVSELADARVREFVPVLAWRRARSRARVALLSMG
jgi:hypothetical protein